DNYLSDSSESSESLSPYQDNSFQARSPEPKNNTLPPTPVVSEPFEELRHYISRLKTQLGCSSNILKNLNSISKISLYLSNSDNLLPLVYYDTMTSSSDVSPVLNKTLLNNSIYSPSNNQHHFLTNTNPVKTNKIVSLFIAIPNLPKTPKYKFNENDSDTDEIIDEVRRLNKLKKEKFRFPSAKCSYDLAGNVYFYEERVKPDLHGYISSNYKEEKLNLISDIFDYYFGEE
ncbi:8495_t:CDS:2, partial [Dentiscutata erythropus]